MAENVVKAIGHHGLWGLSSTFDFIDALQHENSFESTTEPLNILLVNPGDIRHILSTVSRRRRNRSKMLPINFYLLESPSEALAREILLLEIVLDFEIPIRQRANFFLEIFGNNKVQERSALYIETVGQKIIKSAFVNGTGGSLNLLDLSNLKYRDKDKLEECFKNYSTKVSYDMDNYRDHRMRGLYAERYDSRRALYDWDWQYSYHTSITSLIHIRLYRDWRESGIAFEFGDQTYTAPNRTMMSYVEGTPKKGKDSGMKKEVKGFWGDIVASPYFSFGLDTDVISCPKALGLFEIVNRNTGTEQHRHHTVEVALYNILSMLWEIEMGVPYQMTKENDIFSGLGSDGSRTTQSRTGQEKSSGSSNKMEGESLESIKEDVDNAADADDGNVGNIEDVHSDTEMTEANSNLEGKALPNQDLKSLDDEAEMLAKEIRRAECIVECFEGIRIYPLIGQPAEELKKSKYANYFHGMFVSSRHASFCKDTLADCILKENALIAIESGKYIISLLRDEKEEFAMKEKEYAFGHGWSHYTSPPVPRRKRDENDIATDDVLFFAKNSKPSTTSAFGLK